jgi:hypothetical protein
LRYRLPMTQERLSNVVLNGRLGRGGGGLALVPARLCRMDFQALTVCPE